MVTPHTGHRDQCRDLTFIKSNAPRLGINNRSNCASTHASGDLVQAGDAELNSGFSVSFFMPQFLFSFDTTCLRAWYLPCAGALLRCWIRVVPISLPASASLFPAIYLSLSPEEHTHCCTLLYPPPPPPPYLTKILSFP